MAEERMKHRIWAKQDSCGRWVGHFTTARGVRKLPIPSESRDAALIDAGNAMCELLDQQEMLVTKAPPRKAKKFAVSRAMGRRSVRVFAIS